MLYENPEVLDEDTVVILQALKDSDNYGLVNRNDGRDAEEE